MANVALLQQQACASGLACLSQRDLLVFIAQALSLNSGLTATQLMQAAINSGVERLNTRDVFVVIAQRLNDGAGFFADPFSGLLSGWISYSYQGLADNTAIGGPGLEWIDFHADRAAVTGTGTVSFRTLGIGGAFPSVEFGGSNLSIPLPITLAGDFTIVTVAEATADTAWLGHSTLNQQIRFRRSGANVASCFPNGAPELISDAFSTTLGDRVCVTYRRSGTTISFRENKTARNSGINAGTFIFDTMGGSPGGIVGGAGDLGMLLVYNSFRSDAVVDAFYDSFTKSRFGLP